MVVTLGLAVLAPATARANMARTYWGGQLHGPLLAPEATQIRVDDEELSFEVGRTLETAEVVARYRMTNTGAASSDEVSFVYVRAEKDFHELSGAPLVFIDGVAAEFRAVDGAALIEQRPSAAWGHVRPETLSWLVFRLDFAAGQARTVEVRYLHVAGRDYDDRVNPTFTFSYLLSPARSWASFGRLHVRVQVPADTELISSTIPLTRDGHGYRVELHGLPDEELAFSLMSTADLWFGMTSPESYLTLAALVLGLVTLPLAWFTARSLRRSRPRISTAWIALGVGLLVFAVGFVLTLAFQAVTPRYAFGFGYGGVVMLMLILFLATLAGMILASVAAWGREKTSDEFAAYRLKNL